MRISGFYGSLLFVLCFLTASAQKTEQKEADKPTDSVTIKERRYGLRIGVDLYRLTRGLYDKDYKGLELVADYRISPSYYIAAEIGNENKTDDKDRIDYTTKGSYIKAGFDYNTYQNWLNMENIINVGARYGFSTFSQTRNSYKIYNPNPYFGEEQIVPSGDKFDGLTAGWIELVAGLKAEVLHNIFVGFSVRINYLISQTEPQNFANLYIPGFNRTYEGKFGAGFNYTVSYFIPLYKTKKPIEKEGKK
ncbi:DUF6048 family protein [Flavobacterium silvaticum]|uniref:DUF3575 domain-containing protein n=1 Tax=Flavobacterium silvaticum TaxID=1852020 RepID=A0A972FRQ6_9FLAO|nr:DUF6048 family protein [Flavobacterium silvaticum]NMH27278.1 hypothetical protein [Flavobacterium silvaticum]